MKSEETKHLIKKYLAGNATPKEIHLVESFVEEELLSHSWDISAAQKLAFGLKLKQRIDQQVLDQGEAGSVNKHQPKPKTRKLWAFSAAAAIIAFMAIGGLYIVKLRSESRSVRFANDIAPGGNHAILTLADGKKINLTDSKTGELANLKGMSVKKAANGVLVFSVLNADSSGKEDQPNTIETPVGGQYQVNLPDGTRVWLNADSKLKFPTRFVGQNRKVELDGEAYFEVAKDQKHPFFVRNDRQEVEVLGTHFNINSYRDEPAIKTTLLEGSVKVWNSSAEKVIAPGEQAVLSSGRIEVKSVDPELVLDWKNREFRFKNESLTSIMRKLSRWYGVQFVVQEPMGKMPYFSGSVSRFDQISVVLKMLEETGDIKFYINGKVVTVK